MALTMVGCNQNSKSYTAPAPVSHTTGFSADSAYRYVSEQVAFGPRVPGTDSHKRCAQYLQSELARHGAQVVVQQGEALSFDDKPLPIINVIGRFQPQKANRVLLCAHWDSRPFADHDADPALRNTPIDGANDGASGVGVLLEIARQLGQKNSNVGVDIIFFDTEDYGTPDHIKVKNYKSDTWCLGSQYWAKSDMGRDSEARFGILLDMVGAPNAQFCHEMFSQQYAQGVVNKVWSKAAQLGHGSYFVNDAGGYITDDHYYVNQLTRVPCIDIIQYDPSTSTSFGSYWHTHNDTMDNIDKQTLFAVGETVEHVIFSER